MRRGILKGGTAGSPLEDIDLIQVLSHEVTTTRLERLSKRNWRKTVRSDSSPIGTTPTSRRKFGSVGDAVTAVLAEAGADLRFIEVHRRVELLLGGDVARSSVKNSLARGSTSSSSSFVRVAHGRYRLRRVDHAEACSAG